MKEATLHIDLDSILYNYRHLKCYYNKKVIAVLKDNAYGIGLLEVYKTLKDESDLIVALSSLIEVEKLRNIDCKNDIIYLNVFDENDIEFIKANNVVVIVENLKQLELAKKYQLRFHLKFASKMNRLGLNYQDALVAILKINRNLNSYKLEGVMSHFADEDKDHSNYYLFEKYIKKINKKDLIIHCFASSSLNEYFDNITTHIRVGLKLYGIGERNAFLHNVVTLTSPILTIKEAKKDQEVGYDLTYRCKENGYLYILPIGYGQGLVRYKDSICFVDNLFLKQAGKISMDYATYFSTTLIDINKNVELFGKKIPIESLCKINNISPHEIIVSLKVKKEYKKLTLK